MSYSEEQLMREIQKVEFAVVDLHLYLDTHPTDREALTLYNQLAERLKMLKETFSRCYRQLVELHPSYQYPYSWVAGGGWPWTMRGQYMCEEEEY